MVGNVAKWGNSLAVRIPQHLAKEVKLVAGGEVEIVEIDGNLTIKPRIQKQYSLDELIAGITPGNCHAEIDTGVSVGEEIC
ncbi:AbrB/MazE/SpoVT family DNA-binding domain-containing protein [Chamaesiphon sp. VAR_48_metabat_403]|uniref:AbrB/MazE/SpoVT family DNA-binding domain-containing protein n=1 Tax=Chamaesiphon sp. VAR_48_metabat_403 TaxID=2964700 RepID=UPI00286D8227|nr:AbrB/MazE/SpoVT family DNA-binding domain-containing protein [Chamaesiphon sp. VAR_48_metabat_403]